MKEINVAGKIVNGKLNISGKGQLEDFCRLYDGNDVAVRVVVLDGPPTERQLSYWRNVMVPEIRAAFEAAGTRMTRKQAEQYVLSLCPQAVVERPVKTGFIREYKTVYQMTSTELSSVIDHVKQLSAIYLNHYIA